MQYVLRNRLTGKFWRGANCWNAPESEAMRVDQLEQSHIQREQTFRGMPMGDIEFVKYSEPAVPASELTSRQMLECIYNRLCVEPQEDRNGVAHSA